MRININGRSNCLWPVQDNGVVVLTKHIFGRKIRESYEEELLHCLVDFHRNCLPSVIVLATAPTWPSDRLLVENCIPNWFHWYFMMIQLWSSVAVTSICLGLRRVDRQLDPRLSHVVTNYTDWDHRCYWSGQREWDSEILLLLSAPNWVKSPQTWSGSGALLDICQSAWKGNGKATPNTLRGTQHYKEDCLYKCCFVTWQ